MFFEIMEKNTSLTEPYFVYPTENKYFRGSDDFRKDIQLNKD